MQRYEVASDVSIDMSGNDSPCESNMQSYEVASDVSADTSDK